MVWTTGQSALKESWVLRRGMGFTPIQMELAANVLGYVTIFQVKGAPAYYDKYEVIVETSNSPMLPDTCRHKDKQFCARKGYTNLISDHPEEVDAVIVPGKARQLSGMEPVMVVAITNPYYSEKRCIRNK